MGLQTVEQSLCFLRHRSRSSQTSATLEGPRSGTLPLLLSRDEWEVAIPWQMANTSCGLRCATSAECKTGISAVLVVMSGSDLHMSKLWN
jgi:hypothetical protein